MRSTHQPWVTAQLQIAPDVLCGLVGLVSDMSRWILPATRSVVIRRVALVRSVLFCIIRLVVTTIWQSACCSTGRCTGCSVLCSCCLQFFARSLTYTRRRYDCEEYGSLSSTYISIWTSVALLGIGIRT